jgi:hypothetical protein
MPIFRLDFRNCSNIGISCFAFYLWNIHLQTIVITLVFKERLHIACMLYNLITQAQI